MAKSTQLISGDGIFNGLGLQGFINSTKFDESYAVVAIMGPQSSGKSTLLNHLFHTKFPEMNALQRRGQTTSGIWIAKAEGLIQPFTLVLDLEGTDGRERGQDDTTFEKQSALFALAVADIVLINMWCHDIGREHAANKPLLRIVFQVMMQLFSSRKTTLLFVIRDKTETPLHILESILREDIHKIWEAVPKPPKHKATPLTEFFNVKVEALSYYREEQFKKDVAGLRQKYFQCTYGRRGDASGLALTAQEIWKMIKQNKDLDLPALNVMVATVRCQQIASDKFNLLASGKDWLALKKAVESGVVSGFGRIATSILKRCLSEYDSESIYYEQVARKAKRQDLKSKTLQLLESIHTKVLKHLRVDAFERFKNELETRVGKGKGFSDSVVYCEQASMLRFDEGCKDAAIENIYWDTSEVREELCHDIELHASAEKARRQSNVSGVAAGVALGTAAVCATVATTVAVAATGGAAIVVGGVGAATVAAVGAAASIAAKILKKEDLEYRMVAGSLDAEYELSREYSNRE